MEINPSSEHDPEITLDRLEIPILLFALALYIIERCIAFVFLQSRSGSIGGLESQLLDFFFGQPPYSIFDLLLGFDPTGGLLDLLHPRSLLVVTVQIIHFWVNYWMIKLPFRLVFRIIDNRRR